MAVRIIPRAYDELRAQMMRIDEKSGKKVMLE